MYVRAVVPLYPPQSLVGSWLTTHEFLRHLVSRGHRVAVTAYLSAGSTWQSVLHDGVLVEKHFRLIGEPDVVVGHAGDDGSALAIAERSGCPLVTMVHGGKPDVVKAKLIGSDLAVFNSASFAEAVHWDGPTLIAHPPVNPAAYATVPGEHVTLVNLAEDKGGALFWRLADAMPDIPFLGVHGGYGRQLLYGGHANVILQRLTANMRDDVYRRTRVLLMPSHHETWGRVGIEAAASGIPTIARPIPGIVEALGRGAVYVNSSEIADWSSAVRAVLEPAEWKRLSAMARRRVRQHDPADQLERFAAAVEGIVCERCRLGA